MAWLAANTDLPACSAVLTTDPDPFSLRLSGPVDP